MERTCSNGSLNISDVNKEVTLIGWVSKRRNLGSLVFIDLRDYTGITQVVFDELMEDKVKDVRNEFVLQVKGIVLERKDKNPKLKTGEIEVKANEVIIINKAKTTPMLIQDETDALEDTRLKYRYLDLRRNNLQNNLRLRHQVCMITRNHLSDEGFIEVETPILCKSTPEGARDYLVPSRLFKGNFYALPQSPQLYKQLLMIGGVEKYFQIARCFRDEDLRADRQPEFTQIDIEMSFVEEEDIWLMVEGLMKKIFKEIKGIDLKPFLRLPYDECIKRFGSDKPDLRFDLELNDITEIFNKTEFTIFKNIINSNGKINCIVAKDQAANYSRKDLDKLQDFVKIYNAKALSYLKYNNKEITGSIAKVISQDEKSQLIEKLKLENNDLVLIVAAEDNISNISLGALRNKLGHDLNLIDKEKFEFLWVTDFPMFEYSKEENRYVAAHHPFTSIKKEYEDKLFSDPASVYSRAYDLVLNGYELLSGSIRIHDQELQAKVFKAIGISEQEAKDRFGFFLEAFNYGTPPHGGVGIGLERLIMILAGTENIRDVVAFPKTASAADLMSEAPNKVDTIQLDELGIKLK
ncbi:MAG: aspartate--tRNA ligase [Erysipelotrichaceae bacterium]|nr:aspartate--tRNA ligase [Erysipelotrichaceae bacterium]